MWATPSSFKTFEIQEYLPLQYLIRNYSDVKLWVVNGMIFPSDGDNKKRSVTQSLFSTKFVSSSSTAMCGLIPSQVSALFAD